MLEQLKRLDVNRLQLDEALAYAAFAKGLRQEYDTRNIPAPEWLDDAIRALNKDVEGRRRDALEMRLKEIRAQKTQLMTPAEKREALAAEEAELVGKLGG